MPACLRCALMHGATPAMVPRRPTFRGRLVQGAPPLDGRSVRSIGIMLSKFRARPLHGPPAARMLPFVTRRARRPEQPCELERATRDAVRSPCSVPGEDGVPISSGFAAGPFRFVAQSFGAYSSSA